MQEATSNAKWWFDPLFDRMSRVLALPSILVLGQHTETKKNVDVARNFIDDRLMICSIN